MATSVGKKSLTCVEIHINNIKREVLGILHGLEKFHHNCFVHEGSMIIGHKATGGNIQERHCKPIVHALKNTTVNTPAHQNT